MTADLSPKEPSAGARAPAASPGASDEAFDEHAAERRGTNDPGRKPKPSASGPMGDTDTREQRVREEAYRRYEARRGKPGDDIQDWLEAEVDRVSRQSPEARKPY